MNPRRLPIKKTLLWLCFATIVLLHAAPAAAQISKTLYDRLPADIKPPEREHVPSKFKRYIIAFAPGYATLKDTVIVKELDGIAASLEKENEHVGKREQAVNYTAIAEYYRMFRYNNSPNGEWVPYCEKAIGLCKDDSVMSSTTGTAYMQIGDFLTDIGKYEAAQEKYFHALDYLKKVRDTGTMRSVYSLISGNYSYMGLHHEALVYRRMASRFFTEEEKTDGTVDKLIPATFYEFALEYIELYGKEENKAYLDTAWQHIEALKNVKKGDQGRNKEYYYACVWNYYYKTGDYANALRYIDSSLAIEDYFAVLHDQTMICKGICLLKTGHGAAGRKLLVGNPGLGTDLTLGKVAYRALYNDAKDRHDAVAALKYIELLKKYEDSASVLEQQGKVFEITQKYDVREKQSEINTLALKNVAQQKQRNFIIVVAVAVALLLLFVIVLLYALAKKRQVAGIRMQQELNAEKHKMENFLQQQDNQVRAAREHATLEQRKNISRDLHDGLGSTLAALRYYINDMRLHRDNMKEQRMLEDIEMEVASIYIQTRDYMHNLYKGQELANVNLHEFLSGLSDQFSNQQGFHIRLSADMEQIDERLSQEQQKQLYFVIKEAITNTIKHAGATIISIIIALYEESCVFSISDNGAGMDANAVSGIGIQSMVQRVEDIGGQLEIKSGKNGTRLEGVFPVAAHAGLA